MNTVLATRDFWVASGERALKTFAQTLLALVTAQSVGIVSFDWGQGLSLAGMAMLASVLFSIANAAPGPANPPRPPGV